MAGARPVKALDIRKSRHAVIVAPHPDDEAIGAFGLIRQLKAQGAHVRVILVTDGTGSHPGSLRWPAPKLAARRRQETLAVMRSLGIARAHVAFLGFADGSLPDMTRRGREALGRALARSRRCDLLVVPALDDNHPDHRAVALLAANAVPVRRRLEYLVWPGRGAQSWRATHGLRLGRHAAAKRGAILRYRSQNGAITDDPAGFAISHAQLAAFSRPVERFRDISR